MKATTNVPADVLPMPTKSKRSKFLKKLNDGKYLMLLVLPAFVHLMLFSYYPMYGIIVAFQEFNAYDGFLYSEFVGFKHFIRFFNHPTVWRMIRNTFLLSFYSLLWGFPLPIILALVLNETKSARFKKIVQTVSYMPHFFSTVIVVGILTMLFSPTTGVLTHAFASIGIDVSGLLYDAKWFRTIYIASGIWQECGWGAIIYLAALTNVDPQLYEAAVVDGAGKMRCLWNITLPSIAPTIITMLLLRMGSLFSVGFEKAWLLQKNANDATLETSEIISTYVYEAGLAGGNFSYGTAVGLFNSLVCLALVIISNYVAKTVGETSLW